MVSDGKEWTALDFDLKKKGDFGLGFSLSLHF